VTAKRPKIDKGVINAREVCDDITRPLKRFRLTQFTTGTNLASNVFTALNPEMLSYLFCFEDFAS
jgi:hypothetical protein